MTLREMYDVKEISENEVKAKIKLRDFISTDSTIQRYQGNRNEMLRVLNGEAEHCKQINVFNTNIALVHYTGDKNLQFSLFYKCVRDASGVLQHEITKEPVIVEHKPNDTFVIDGNTRRFAWELMNEQGLLTEEQLDTELDVAIMEVNSGTAVRRCYEMFDTKSSTKSARHTMETVAAQVGLDSKNLSTLKGALRLVNEKLGGKSLNQLSKEFDTEVDLYEHLVTFFGKEHIRSFSNLYESWTGKTNLTGMSPHIVAYRKLREEHGRHYYGVIDEVFTQWYKKEFDPKYTVTGNVRVWDWMCDVTNKTCFFNPKGSTARIKILSSVFILGFNAKIKGKDPVRKRLPFRDHEDGVKSLLEKVSVV